MNNFQFIKTIQHLGIDTNVDARRDRLITLISPDRKFIFEQDSSGSVINLKLPARKYPLITLMAHYDLYPGSRGYNDNGSGLATLLSLHLLHPDFIEIVFVDKEESGGLGSNFYMQSNKAKFVINIDVAGAGEYVQFAKYPASNQSFSYDFIPENYDTIERFNIPFSDNHVVQSHGVPSMLIFAGEKGEEVKAVSRIWSLQHCNENDNKIELLSEVVLKKVSEFTKETIENYLKTKVEINDLSVMSGQM